MARADVQFVVQSPFDVTCKFPQCLHVTHSLSGIVHDGTTD